MLLLYRVRYILNPIMSIFTFHYASTVSYAGSVYYKRYIHLHSIMLLLYLGFPNSLTFSTIIYIPLCFYCIWSDKFPGIFYTNLHSIMLLLYHGQPQSTDISDAYLHSIMLLLYPGSGIIKSGAVRFTFHYASTVSTIWNRLMADLQNLHSIMLLLYRIYFLRRLKDQLHLHSIMLLLYLLRFWIAFSLHAQFTFHYASTVSYKMRIFSGILSTFTFHYASTVSNHVIDRITIHHNLHSIMLLLYP